MGVPAKFMQLLKSSTNIQARVALAFWLFGLINNVLYVIILSAAVDLVPSDIPKGIVLLADIFPAFVAKLVAPYFIHVIPYGARMFLCAGVSAGGMLLVAYSPAVSIKLLGIGLASLASGIGEMTFLGLTHFYGRISLAGFASGTGAAGLVGAGLYALATTTLGLSSHATITASSILPAAIVFCFYFALPRLGSLNGYTAVSHSHAEQQYAESEETRRMLDDVPQSPSVHHEVHASLRSSTSSMNGTDPWSSSKQNLTRAKKLVIPYMLPLFIVYTMEYVAISGVAPTLLFPPQSTPFHHYRDFYPAYQALYQAGVFISRSSILFLRLKNIYIPSLLQIVNLVVLTLHALLYFLPNVWVVFLIFIWTGLLGGAVYVNAFAKIGDEVEEEEREFSLSATTVADSTGILLASLIAMALEPAVCNFQTDNGRDWCKRT